ncbi:Glycosyltransferase involved in cell wall bisynthesis [Tardiphaga sp. OK246]|uniref:glycosyltransferase family 2 protein n=1 Tax=Tardiphaga sp. OK246 TaxID=1855307 RepID=UPI000B703798|nr:glycosyltransferase family 2 protein [Tardiphaga sp. OK246]SNT63987.1 Glycosyltransferase involved in cell wall bisynthesis [Tardiphaga sp. OK246]
MSLSPSLKVVILLATRNGARYLPEQLESYRVQSHQNWELLVSDDGSTDETVQIIEKFAQSVPQKVALCEGPRKGFWQNFMSTVHCDEIDGDLFAFSDQDDVWFAEKLERAVMWIAAQQTDQPLLYFSRTEIIDQQGNPTGLSPLFERRPSFRNALVQNIGGGNTMVFNLRARDALRQVPQDVQIVSHDWWTYQVIAGIGGTIHYDPLPSLGYRQHGENIVGSNSGARARFFRIAALAKGQLASWNDINISALNNIRGLLTPSNAQALDWFASSRKAILPVRLYRLWRSGVYRQSFPQNLGLLVGAMISRL